MAAQQRIQFNLLPDVKLVYLRARKTRQVVMLIAIGVMVITIVVVMVLFSLLSVQSRTMKDLTTKTNSELKDIKSFEDLEKFLTLQSQLQSLPDLHAEKTDTSNVFELLNRLIPVGVVLQDVAIEHEDTSITISGNASTLELVNVLADTLKFTTFTTTTTVDEQKVTSDPVNAFTGVTTSANRSDEKVGFVMTATFDPQLFMNVHTVAFQVPSKVTSRSVIEQPAVFDGVPSLDPKPTEDSEATP